MRSVLVIDDARMPSRDMGGDPNLRHKYIDAYSECAEHLRYLPHDQTPWTAAGIFMRV